MRNSGLENGQLRKYMLFTIQPRDLVVATNGVCSRVIFLIVLDIKFVLLLVDDVVFQFLSSVLFT